MKIDDLHIPHINCLHPIVIERNGVKQIVPCGHCKACAISRANVLTQVCDMEGLAHKYCLFATLTYSEQYVPFFRRKPLTDDEMNLVKRYKSVSHYNSHFTLERRKPLKTDAKDIETDPHANFYGYFSEGTAHIVNGIQDVDDPELFRFLYKPDIQRFVKRLLSKLNYGRKNKITLRYFYVGEYGPVHLRPHYHLLLWFDDLATALQCKESVLKVWKFGRTDCSFSQGGCSHYCSSYVNSFACLPDDFRRLRMANAFCSKCNRLGFGFFIDEKPSFYASEQRESSELDSALLQRWTSRKTNGPLHVAKVEPVQYTSNGKNYEVFLYRYAKNWLYPRTLGSDVKDRQSIKEDFLLYDRLLSYVGDVDSVSDLARIVIEDMRTCWFDTVSKKIRPFYTAIGIKRYRHWTPDCYENELANIFLQVHTSSYYVSQLEVETPIPFNLDTWLFATHDVINRNTLQVSNISNYDVLFSYVYRQLSVSRHFIECVIERDYSLVDKYLDVITSFYAQGELDYYNNYVSLFCNDDYGFSSEFLLGMFPDTYDYDTYSHTSEFDWYRNNIQERTDRRIKHKVLNDKNQVLWQK